MRSLKPVAMSRDELLALLTDMIERVRLWDSFGGSIEYDALDHLPEGKDFWVHGVYRMGNSEGQGGVRMIGEVHEDPPSPHDPMFFADDDHVVKPGGDGE